MRRSISLAEITTALLMLGVLASNVTLAGGLAGDEGTAIKVYHVLLLTLAPLLLSPRGIVRWRPEITIYLVTLGATATVTTLVYPAHAFIANWIVAIYAFCVAGIIGRALDPARLLRAIRVAVALLLLAILAKLWVFRLEMLAFLAAPSNHPPIPTIVGGGVNVEASLLGLATAFFVGSRWLWPYVGLQLLLSAAYGSRVGFVSTACILGLAGIAAVTAARRDPARHARLGRTLAIGAVVVVVLGVFVAVLLANQSGAGFIVRRFTKIGEDAGSVGRLRLWLGGLELFPAHPFGVGLGNAAPFLGRELGLLIPESNLHNQYLQHLVELGIQGFIAWCVFVAVTVRRLARSAWRDPILCFVVGYFGLSLLQYRGADAAVWLLLGLHHGIATGRLAPGSSRPGADSPSPCVADSHP